MILVVKSLKCLHSQSDASHVNMLGFVGGGFVLVCFFCLNGGGDQDEENRYWQLPFCTLNIQSKFSDVNGNKYFSRLANVFPS